jgi:hypothetical protein
MACCGFAGPRPGSDVPEKRMPLQTRGSYRRRLSDPGEIGTIDPDPMQDHGELAGKRHIGAFAADPSDEPDRSGFERRPAHYPSEQHVRSVEQRGADHRVIGLGNPAVAVGRARLILARHASEVRAYGS